MATISCWFFFIERERGREEERERRETRDGGGEIEGKERATAM